MAAGAYAPFRRLALALGRRFERIRNSIYDVAIEQPAPTGAFH